MQEHAVTVSAEQIALLRSFNRDYTRRLGLLQQALHDSPYSLTEVRVMYEIAHRRDVTAAELAQDLGLDRGYLSRILKRLTSEKLLVQRPAASDARRRHLALTLAGRKRFAGLDRKAQQQAAQLLSQLDEPRRHAVLAGMHSMHHAFNASAAAQEVTLRTHRPGDMGWVVARHGELYFEEYGWDERFEGLVAEVVGQFIGKLDPHRERCWIAQRNGERLGCIFVVAKNRTTAKLRLLLVEPSARGSGLGRRLIEECIQFARTAGYGKMELWTQQNLSAARHLYARAGFEKIAEQVHSSFGPSLVAETWSLDL